MARLQLINRAYTPKVTPPTSPSLPRHRLPRHRRFTTPRKPPPPMAATGSSDGGGGEDAVVMFESRAASLLESLDDSDIWIFGFGSLVHTPGFEYTERVAGFIKGWKRVWWQGSTDHRGTPEAPGRTVTLTRDAESITWGAAFRLAGTPAEQRQTLSYLEWREKQYDLREKVSVFASHHSDAEPAVRGALCYIATNCSTANPNFLGPAPLEAIAAQIAISRGPSGHNFEYLFKLADAMRAIPAHDEELFDLERHVREKLRASGVALESLEGGEEEEGGGRSKADPPHSSKSFII